MLNGAVLCVLRRLKLCFINIMGSTASSSSSVGNADHALTERIYFGTANKSEDLIRTLEQSGELDVKIERVTIYKLPLINYQLTQLVFYHNFVLFKTRNWWWTIEKNTEGIDIQRSTSEADVKGYLRQNKRITGMMKQAEKSGGKSIRDLIQWLFKHTYLIKEYHPTSSNCQQFAVDAFNFIKA